MRGIVCSFCERGLTDALPRAENSTGGLIYCLPSVALPLSFTPPGSNPPVLHPHTFSFCLILFHSALVLHMQSLLNTGI